MGDKHDDLDYPRSERSSRRQQVLAQQSLERLQQQQAEQLRLQSKRQQQASAQAAKKARKNDDDNVAELRVSEHLLRYILLSSKSKMFIFYNFSISFVLDPSEASVKVGEHSLSKELTTSRHEAVNKFDSWRDIIFSQFLKPSRSFPLNQDKFSHEVPPD